nr:unnamed protein product [Callosobruchus analis]
MKLDFVGTADYAEYLFTDREWLPHNVEDLLKRHVAMLLIFDKTLHKVLMGENLNQGRKPHKVSKPVKGYKQCYNESRRMIQHHARSLSLTPDCWSSMNSESYIRLTAHFLTDEFGMKSISLNCSIMDGLHTSKMLASKISTIIDEWEIKSKIALITSDNAANISNAFRHGLGYKHFGCFAHTLKSAAPKAIDMPKLTAVIVKTFVAYFKRSNIANQKGMKYQQQNGREPLKLIHEVKTH